MTCIGIDIGIGMNLRLGIGIWYRYWYEFWILVSGIDNGMNLGYQKEKKLRSKSKA